MIRVKSYVDGQGSDRHPPVPTGAPPSLPSQAGKSRLYKYKLEL